MIHDPAPRCTTTEGTDRERHPEEASDTRIHGRTGAERHTGAVNGDGPLDVITFGPDAPSDDELRLCGDVSGGKRAIELGVSNGHNAIAFAMAGAKSIAVDPDPERIARIRELATEHELRVECHEADLADLGFATSGSVELVVADRTLATTPDLGRVLRQVHRVLRTGQPFVIVLEHPFVPVAAELAGGGTPPVYGTAGRTLGDWFTSLYRANFRVDALHELGATETHPAPTTLVLRARKEGS